MDKGKRHTLKLKLGTFKQITERGSLIEEVAERLGICTKTLYH